MEGMGRVVNGETTGDVFGERDQRVTGEAWRGMPLLAPSSASLFFFSFVPLSRDDRRVG